MKHWTHQWCARKLLKQVYLYSFLYFVYFAPLGELHHIGKVAQEKINWHKFGIKEVCITLYKHLIVQEYAGVAKASQRSRLMFTSSCYSAVGSISTGIGVHIFNS